MKVHDLEKKNRELTEDEVREKLLELPVSLPPSFFDWVAKYQGASVSDEGLEILTESGSRRIFVEVMTPDEIIFQYNESVDEDEEFFYIIPFAFDRSNCHFCFDYRNKTTRIIYFDTDYLISETPEAAEKVCNGFDDFLNQHLSKVKEK
ncbi:SMI1/KNR4 family protein [Mechercharimyces sp. CAU 1602]|uniref:SMI1/KNR4 family protein n=1 Tax=Mechercharimyces sp. CAU 1602 TaxID=2973933 RepID=UPI0021618B9F|nr:SMI1/KNR4 family protein [Mechercharimyces sp. CAU 1602]MCS1351674.1 SMI1/KNR4 family protein [Mechercharimyces sp. CAU 1602]